MMFWCRFETGSTWVLSSSQMWQRGLCCTPQHPTAPVLKADVKLIANRNGILSLGTTVTGYIEIWTVRFVHVLRNKLSTWQRACFDHGSVCVSQCYTFIRIPSTARPTKCCFIYGSLTKKFYASVQLIALRVLRGNYRVWISLSLKNLSRFYVIIYIRSTCVPKYFLQHLI